ncbi:glycoside hydrolase family 108 protein [Paracoccus suum]|nr:glycoside hydrolase family 108 protein [Paracoccus suum]
MRGNFEECLSEVLKHEGGYVNDPRDPGGETNMGISRRTYPNENIKGMTRARAAVLYRRDFWDAVQGDALPPGLDLVAFDGAVNSGPRRGAEWLQAGIGGLEIDGKIGQRTLIAATETPAVVAIDRACDARLAFLRRLGTWPHFGVGWSRRVAAVRARALQMASQRPLPRPTPDPAAQPAAQTSFWAWLTRIFGA